MAHYSSNALATSGNAWSSYDSSGGIFEPDVILPGQFTNDEGGLSGGERKLMAALLSDGIEAYIAQETSPKSPRRRKQVDAAEWVETKDLSYVFSFDNVCECLGINPDYLRLGLLRYIESVRQSQARGESPKNVWKKIRRPRKQ